MQLGFIFSWTLYGQLLLTPVRPETQIGQGYLTPNNPAVVPSIVKYGTSATNLNLTATGAAEVSPKCCFLGKAQALRNLLCPPCTQPWEHVRTHARSFDSARAR